MMTVADNISQWEIIDISEQVSMATEVYNNR